MTYKEAITASMTALAADPAVCFIGYGTKYGRAMGTLAGVRDEQLIETPVAENLMVGLATGLSLRGRKPVVFIERADFLLNALDAIVNHLCKIDVMSRGQFRPAAILRVVVGNKEKPLFTGETHTQDFSDALWRMEGRIQSSKVLDGEFAIPRYMNALERLSAGETHVFWEYKDLY